MNGSGFFLTVALFCLLAAALTGCSDAKQTLPLPPKTVTVPRVTGAEPFTLPPLSDNRRYDSVIAADLDRDAHIEYIVSSIGQDSLRPPGARADLVQIFRYDSISHAFIPVLADSAKWIMSVELRDLTGDGRPEIILNRNAGGNDVVATRGMSVLSCLGQSATAFQTLYAGKSGSPTFSRIGDSTEEVLIIHGELWPDGASHADAVIYTDDVLGLRGGVYSSVRRRYRSFFLDQAEQGLKRYAAARRLFVPPKLKQGDSLNGSDSLEKAASLDSLRFREGLRLYFPAALAMIAFSKSDSPRPLRSFWDSEHAYLREQLATVQFIELSALYTRLIGM